MKYLVVALVLFSSPALAVDLELDLSKPILAVDGKTPRKECVRWGDAAGNAQPPCLESKELTLGSAIAEVLSVRDPELKGAQGPKNGAWAQMFAVAQKITLSADMISAIKEQSAKFADPVTSAQIWEAVEPGSTKK